MSSLDDDLTNEEIKVKWDTVVLPYLANLRETESDGAAAAGPRKVTPFNDLIQLFTNDHSGDARRLQLENFAPYLSTSDGLEKPNMTQLNLLRFQLKPSYHFLPGASFDTWIVEVAGERKLRFISGQHFFLVFVMFPLLDFITALGEDPALKPPWHLAQVI